MNLSKRSRCGNRSHNSRMPSSGTAALNFLPSLAKRAWRSASSRSEYTSARAVAPAQLERVDGFLIAAPFNRILLQLCAQGYLEYTFGLLEDDLEATPDNDKHAQHRKETVQRATDYYDRSLDFALRLIATED